MKRVQKPSLKKPDIVPVKARKIAKLPWIVGGLFLGCIALAAVTFSWWYLTAFEQAANESIPSLYSEFKTGWTSPLPHENQHTNILLLGLDEIGLQRNGSLLTDSIILLSLDHKTGEITLLSIPRDLWIAPLQTKINALYYFGELAEDTTGKDMVIQTIEEVTGVPIHFSLVLKLNTVRSIINAIDHVSIDIEDSFTDTKFPKEGVDPSITPEALRYETVEFKAGNQQLDGDQALKFIRSRHSENQEEGTDISRSKRQQQLISAIVARLKSKDVLLNPAIIGALYQIWQTEVDTDLSNTNIASMLRLFRKHPPQFTFLKIPIDQDEGSVIYHPPTSRYNQWVYEPYDHSWAEFSAWYQSQLNIESSVYGITESIEKPTDQQ